MAKKRAVEMEANPRKLVKTGRIITLTIRRRSRLSGRLPRSASKGTQAFIKRHSEAHKKPNHLGNKVVK
jgi:hypothetical protein